MSCSITFPANSAPDHDRIAGLSELKREGEHRP
jgi:hypothetical protein